MELLGELLADVLEGPDKKLWSVYCREEEGVESVRSFAGCFVVIFFLRFLFFWREFGRAT